MLTSVHTQLRTSNTYLNPSITESWLRKWQVLPGRTHPFMSMSGSGGFLLTATKVYAEHATSSILASRHEDRAKASQRKKAKLAAEAEAAASGTTTPTAGGAEEMEEGGGMGVPPSSAPERMEVDGMLEEDGGEDDDEEEQAAAAGL